MTSRDWRPGTPGRYYMRRDRLATEAGFGEEYWRNIMDPDGNCRDRTTERLQHISDLEQEFSFVNDLTPGRILDAGCGLGFFLSGIDEGWEKHGVEVSEFAARHAREWAEVQLGSLEDAKYPDNHFDVVMCHHVIEHVEHPEGLVDEIHRVLRAGGLLILGTPDFDSGCARRFGPKYRLLHDPTHISLFTHESVLRFARDHGFIVERVEYPFFETRHFTKENFERLFDADQMSPPFYGNFMTLYCRKPQGGVLTLLLQRLGSHSPEEMLEVDKRAAAAVQLVVEAIQTGGRFWVTGTPCLRLVVEAWRGLGDSNGGIARFGVADVLGNHDVVIALCKHGEPNSHGQKSEMLYESTSAKSAVVCAELVVGDQMDSKIVISLRLHRDCSVDALEVALLSALIESARDRLSGSSPSEADS